MTATPKRKKPSTTSKPATSAKKPSTSTTTGKPSTGDKKPSRTATSGKKSSATGKPSTSAKKPTMPPRLPAKTATLPHVTLSAEANKRLRLIDRNKQLTWVLRDAIAYIGSHRKTDVIPRRASCPVSLIAANRLIKLGFAMWLDEKKTIVMLTFHGERAYAAIKDKPEPM